MTKIAVFRQPTPTLTKRIPSTASHAVSDACKVMLRLMFGVIWILRVPGFVVAALRLTETKTVIILRAVSDTSIVGSRET